MNGASRNFQVDRLEAGDPVIGLLPFETYEEKRCVLQPDDLLLAYTDGISQAMSEHEEEWGEDRMLAVAQFDDMTLLVLKLQETPTVAESTLSDIAG